METGTHSPWVSRLLDQQGHRVIVANARKLRAICSPFRPQWRAPGPARPSLRAAPSPRCRAPSASHTKNDAEDARMLARLGRADPALLSPIQHRSEQGQRALVRLKVREALVRSH
ncbi:MAG: hypothetical protein KF715_14985 [Candidatus Didemnitutus sp.]|nr:hypothetical protein [Candidatus Didemnitutus sp.]